MLKQTNLGAIKQQKTFCIRHHCTLDANNRQTELVWQEVMT